MTDALDPSDGAGEPEPAAPPAQEAQPAATAAPGGDARPAAAARTRVVLNVGSGPVNPEKLHPLFRGEAWHELRLDIDPRVKPDIVASMSDLSCLADASIDAVWSSHNIEHLFEHEAQAALREMARILRPQGFALITTPDIVRVAREIAMGRLEETLYVSPAGPIAPIDILYGLRKSIAAGNAFMAHRTAFSPERLGRMLVEAGFAEARVWDGDSFDLWAMGLMPQADYAAIADGVTA